MPFDYNLLFLVLEHAYIVCPTPFIAKFWKFLLIDFGHKGNHSSKPKSPNLGRLPVLFGPFLACMGRTKHNLEF